MFGGSGEPGSELTDWSAEIGYKIRVDADIRGSSVANRAGDPRSCGLSSDLSHGDSRAERVPSGVPSGGRPGPLPAGHHCNSGKL